MARILVVDDENNIRLMVRLALQAAGHEVETAADGPEGLDKFGAGMGWDLVLLDQRMPGLTGLDVLREMRQRQPAAQVVMITAFGTIDLATSALQAGVADFLRKPFTTDLLRGAVASALKGTPAPRAQPEARQPASFSQASINGFRIAARDDGVSDTASIKDGTIQHRFTVQGPDSATKDCQVLLPSYFTELVKAHTDCDEIPDAGHFWLWLCEEALANYLWQNAEMPLDGLLQVDELTTGLRRWVDAVLTQN